ncbi:unnamed protein product [Mucor fragilis]
MHQKHIVHRDLKLENLLLSKDRDIIITDFGFANRFQVAQEDLMVTSCGSPCYAAPELVINDESQYVGTAVDIWSCGVILFAMLCGYLPFDDDPTNPQGANINVLYKYIVSTRLEIPKSMSIDATHLLRRMLVPDPAKRCTMEEIKRHPWLSEHQHLFVVNDNHMNSATVSSDARLSAPAAAAQDETSTTMLPLHEPESREEDVTVPEASPPTPKASNSSTTTASSSSSSPASVIHTTAAAAVAPVPATTATTDHVAQSPLPVTATTATSFLQAKFISTLQPQQPQPQRSYQQPMSTNNKVPNRSVSVQPQHQSKYNTKRERTTSEYNKQQQQQQKHQSLQMLPSVSETTIHDDISFSDRAKLKGQKLMEWFIKRSKSQSTKFPSRSAANHSKVPERQQQPQRPISALPNPIRAMPIGKPLGSYAADFNDSKLRLHRGAVDQDALTSKAPNEVLHEIKECLSLMGIDMKKCHDFKIKCVRPARRRHAAVPDKTSANANTPAKGGGTRTRKSTTTIPFKLFFNSSSNSSSNHISPKTTATTSTTHIIYGEQGIDNGEQVQFNVELSKIENLPGLYVVDIKRTRGNIWAFKYLYHTLLDLLDLSGGGGQGGVGYMAQRRVSGEKVEDLVKNRKSYMTTSSSGSSSIVVYQ